MAGAGGGTANAAGASGSTAGAIAGSSGAATQSGAAGSSGAGTGGSTGSAAGAGGSVGSSGAAGTAAGAGAGGGPTSTLRSGPSAGCGKVPPASDSSTKFSAHEVHITGLDPIYVTGMYKRTSAPYDFTFRPYAVRLPANYDPNTKYAVTFGGGGCGSGAAGFATSPSGGMQIAPNGQTIQIGLTAMNGCFNDGGPSIGNRTDTPEEPYFRAIMADIEQSYCFDLSKVFVSGSSSGAWEAYTLGCAAADLIRGISADEGGMRDMHPACPGPTAAVLVAGTADTENPIGPLDPNNASDKIAIGRLGSYGSAPGRDELLTRNHCVGTATAALSGALGASYPACVQYTGCPAAYPVIWCALPGVTHNSSTSNGVSYAPGPMWNWLGALPAAP